MQTFTNEELKEALRAIDSTISKCEKVQPKLKSGTSQHTLLVRRIKAFQIASSLIEQELANQKEGVDYLDEYKRLLQTTNLQKGYQAFVKDFRQLRTYLQKELPEYVFTGNIVENNMDYAYFQFTNDALKTRGLKIVIAFVHMEFSHQIWLSGMNRGSQAKHFENFRNIPHPYTLTDNPNKTDYILKETLIGTWDSNNMVGMQKAIKSNAVDFIKNVERLLNRGI